MATSANRGRRARLRLRTLVRWLWLYETTPVSPDETLLHSIPNNQAYFLKEMGAWAVSPTAFKPHHRRDLDGMSFFRDDFTSARKMAATNPHPDGVRIAQVGVGQLKELDMHAVPAPDEAQLPGHAIVPDMRYLERPTPAQKQRTKERQLRLAEFATRNGLYTPKGLKDPAPRV